MSWNLVTRKLKETHLGPFSKANATDKGKVDSPVPSSSDSASLTNDEALGQASAIKSREPGILVVTLHEARGLSLPEQYQNGFPSQFNQSYHSIGNALSMASSTRPTSSSQAQITFSDWSDRPRSSSGRGLTEIRTAHGQVSGNYMPYALVDFENVQVFINSVGGDPQNPLWAGSNTQYKFDVSRVAELNIHLFIHNPNAPPRSGRTHDIFLGVVRVNPWFEAKPPLEDATLRKKVHQQTQGYSGNGWVDVEHGTGKLQLGVEYVQNQAEKLTIDDFDLLKVVGKGSFGRVMQVRKKNTNRIYAMKTIQKAKIISRSEVAHTLAERSVLAQINNPFIVPMKFCFQSPTKLYFVLAFVNGGELFYHLTRERRFDINRSRFYTAELLCALECLHGFNVIYRDLKPENILLDYQGHIALCDFGLCKLKMEDEDQTNTFCGTPEYLAPELLLGQGYNKTVDWWTLGVLLYEMLTGLPPFYDEVTDKMYRKILSETLRFPGVDVVPPTAQDLLTKLLNRDPAKRLGANGSAEIKAHPFFHAIDWRKLLERKYEPAFKPNVSSAYDTEQIEIDVTTQPAEDSWVPGPTLSDSMQEQFIDFSYKQPVAGLTDAGGSIVDPSFLDGSEVRR